MEIAELRKTLEGIKKANQQKDWLAGLDERKMKELEFHNRDRDKAATQSLPQDTYELLHGNKKFYSTVALSKKYIDNWLASHVAGKVFLDYACGNGGTAIRAAQLGAGLSIGLDISDVSIQNATDDAKTAGVGDRCLFLQGDCENTGLPSNSIDVIVCSGMLHHLDLSHSFPELRRILKPGGKLLAVEALNYNPIIKLYREMTPSMRTEWEKNHILSLKDLDFAKRFFRVGEVRYWHLLSIFSVVARKNETLMNGLLSVANKLDSVLLRLPLMRLMAWQFTFELEKAPEA